MGHDGGSGVGDPARCMMMLEQPETSGQLIDELLSTNDDNQHMLTVVR